MAVRKRGNSWQIDYIDPTGKRVRQSFKTKKEAMGELEKRRTLIREKRYMDVKPECTTTFDQLAERYEESFRHQRSFERSKVHFIKTLKDQFSGWMLDKITYYECEKFRTDRQNTLTRKRTVRTNSTINKEVNTLRHMLKKAVSWEMLDRSPFEKGETLHLRENNRRLRYLSTEEIQALLEECPAHLRDIMEVDLCTGMRRGELLSLKWPQIAGGFIYLHETKTDEARQIPILKDLEAVLKRIRQHQWG
jgi:integrase